MAPALHPVIGLSANVRGHSHYYSRHYHFFLCFHFKQLSLPALELHAHRPHLPRSSVEYNARDLRMRRDGQVRTREDLLGQIR